MHDAPWGALGSAGAMHALVALVLIAVVSLHLPKRMPDQPVISLVSEAPPQGSAAPAAPALPMPQAAATRASSTDLPLPPPPTPKPPQKSVQKARPAQASLQGSQKKAEKKGAVAVTVIRQAVPYADNIAPDYSQDARNAGEQGTVNFTVSVTPLGTVGDVVITKGSGYPDLDANAVAAALQWRFRPALKNGVPVSATLHLWIRFETR